MDSPLVLYVTSSRVDSHCRLDLTHRQSSKEDTVAVRVENQVFHVSHILLAKHSYYFDVVLDGNADEGPVREMEIDPRISPADFGLYLDVVHRLYFNDSFWLRPRRHLRKDHGAAEQLLALLDLGDWFINNRVYRMASSVVSEHMDDPALSLEREWAERYRRGDDEGALVRCAVSMERHYLIGRTLANDPVLAGDMVRMCAGFPAQLLRRALLELGDRGFIAEVSRRFAERWIDRDLDQERERALGAGRPEEPEDEVEGEQAEEEEDIFEKYAHLMW